MKAAATGQPDEGAPNRLSPGSAKPRGGRSVGVLRSKDEARIWLQTVSLPGTVRGLARSENRAGPSRHMKAPKPIGPSFPLRWGRFFWPELGSCRSCAGRRSDSGLFQSALGELDGSSNSWNATSTTASQSSQRKNPASVSTVAGAVWQASHTLHRVHIGKLGHK